MYNVEIQAKLSIHLSRNGTILADKISQDLKLHLDLPGVWWNLHLSDDGVFKSGDRVLELKTIMISYMSSSNLYVPDGRWFVIQRRGDGAGDAFSYHLVALVVSEMFVWDTTSCKNISTIN
jgi:hypothetical protein